MFQNRGVEPQRRPVPEEQKKTCKIIIKRKGNVIEKSIEGDCSVQSLRALSEKQDLEE